MEYSQNPQGSIYNNPFQVGVDPTALENAYANLMKQRSYVSRNPGQDPAQSSNWMIAFGKDKNLKTLTQKY